MTTTATTPTSIGAAAWYGPGAEGEPPANVHGFVISQFPRYVFHVVQRTLGDPAAFAAASRGAHTGIVLGTVFGDSATADAVCERLAAGTVHNPMLFFQSVPTSVLGALCRDYRITGPISCISSRRDTAARLLAAADELLDEPGIDEVLVIGIELISNERVAAVIDRSDADIRVLMPSADTAAALLLSRASEVPAVAAAPPVGSPRGWLHGLIEICDGVRP